MKETTVHSLLIARTLFERATELCRSDDRYLASAGLILVQDALEMVFYALLIERGVDDTANLERKSFDELIGELKNQGVSVPKSGTMKALNKQRVLVKHNAQVAEPATVRNYFAAAEQVLNQVVAQVIGFPLQELFLTVLLEESESKSFLQAAEQFIAQKEYLKALIEIRKAVFVEFEQPYNILPWENVDSDDKYSMLTLWRYDHKAPIRTRDKNWIANNVSDPTQYIQIDHNVLRIEALEYGIHTAELNNLRRLTPDVFRPGNNSSWAIRHDASFPANEGTEANSKYCLDRAIAIVLKKQEYKRTHRLASHDTPFTPPPIYAGNKVFKKASTDSEVVHTVTEDFTYSIIANVTGFDYNEHYYQLLAQSPEMDDYGLSKEIIIGYLLVQQEGE